MISDCDNYSMVVIFYCGFPFAGKYNKEIRGYPDIPSSSDLSAVDFPAVSFCLYKGNKRLANIHRIFGKDKIKSKGNEINIDNNVLKTVCENGINKYLVNINLDFPYRKSVVSAVIEIQENKCLSCDDYFTIYDEDHFWSPRSPLCKINAKIKIDNKEINLTGTGYSDRNYGRIPIFHNIKEWFWGRFHSEEINLIYYHINYFNNQPMRILFLYDKNALTGFYNNFTESFSRKKNYFLLNYFSKIGISSEAIRILISNNSKVDNGPFYIRFLSDFNINYRNNNISGKGFSEYISPQRLRWRFLYPFISVKIKSEKIIRTDFRL